VQVANENNGRLPIRVEFFLDEFGNMPPINGFDNKITVAAGRGIRFHLVVQDFGQLQEKYGEKSRIIKNNTHTWVYLLTKDPQTASEISKMTGTYTVETQNVSSSIQAKSYSHGLSSNLTGRALLTPDEVTRNPYGQGIVFLQREYPARTILPDYKEGPAKNDIFPYESDGQEYHFREIPLYVPGVIDDYIRSKNNQEDIQEATTTTPKSILDKIDKQLKDDEVAASIENAPTEEANGSQEIQVENSDFELPTSEENQENFKGENDEFADVVYEEIKIEVDDFIEPSNKKFSLNDID